MPYVFKSPGSFNDSVRRNGLMLHPSRHEQLFVRESSLHRATNPDTVPDDRLGPDERVMRQQFRIAQEAGEIVVAAESFDLPITPVAA